MFEQELTYEEKKEETDKSAAIIASFIADSTGIEIPKDYIIDIYYSYDDEGNVPMIEFKEEILGDVVEETKFTGIDFSAGDGTIFEKGEKIGILNISPIDKAMSASFYISANTSTLSLSEEVLIKVGEAVADYNSSDK